jgi:stearoyl-CoA desaturase (delta-9 desaturase)
MTRAHKTANLVGVLLPAAGVVLALVLLWGEFVGPEVLAITLVMYFATGLGISVGFHRLLAHRAFDAAAPVRAALAILGSMAFQGPVTKWVANHRKHHAFSDEEGDPHSPHLSGQGGAGGAVAGLWHAHMGWILYGDRPLPERYARDLQEDRVVRAIDRTFALWVAVGLAIPFLAGLGLVGSLEGGLLALLWGGLVRIFLLHHMTFAVNSLCHFMGRRRFATDDESRNVPLLAPISFGESWHNNHHAFPMSAFHGLRAREIDPGGWLIWLLERLGLVWNVRRVSPARLAAKLDGTGPSYPRAERALAASAASPSSSAVSRAGSSSSAARSRSPSPPRASSIDA